MRAAARLLLVEMSAFCTPQNGCNEQRVQVALTVVDDYEALLRRTLTWCAD